jgi:hypothetical protein
MFSCEELYLSPVSIACYDAYSGTTVSTGDTTSALSPYIPKIWAMESLRILKENMGVASLVHRDFQNEVASYGDLVHTRRPGEFKIRRRSDTTDVQSQTPIAGDVQVPLDQWFNETFTIPEGAMSKSFLELVTIFLEPAILEIARGVDRAVLGRLANSFLGAPGQRAGHLGDLSRESAYDAVVAADEILNINKAYPEDRFMLLSPSAKAVMLQCDKFVEAQKRGDGGKALRTAELGAVLGFQSYMFQNVPSVLSGADAELGTVTAAHAAGSLDSMAVSISDAVAGEFATVAGNDQPTWISAVAATSGNLTLNEANAYATQAGAALVRYKACAVDASAQSGSQYPAGWVEGIILKSYGSAPQVGQLLALGSGAGRKLYTIIETDPSLSPSGELWVLLDRPLEIAVNNSDPAFPGPMGSINVCGHKNCLALVTRPLATTHAAGIEFGVQEDYGVGIRVAMQHHINKGLVVAVDLLAGVAVLDTRLAVPLFG